MCNFDIGTLNILDPIFAEKWEESEGLDPETKRSNWTDRKEKLVKVIQSSNLDILCLQEISRAIFEELAPSLERMGYQTVHVPHGRRHDGVAVCFKSQKMELQKNISLVTQGKLSAACVDMRDKTTGVTIRVASCHLSCYEGPEATQQINELVSYLKTLPGNMSLNIIAGDFNADAIRDPQAFMRFQVLRQANYREDGDVTETLHFSGRRYDWVWVQSNEQFRLAHIPIFHETVSDHTLSATKVTKISI